MTDADPVTPRTVMPIESSPLFTEPFGPAEVTELRHMLTSFAAGSGLSGQRLEDFVLAVNELITNAVRHGGGRGWLRLGALAGPAAQRRDGRTHLSQRRNRPGLWQPGRQPTVGRLSRSSRPDHRHPTGPDQTRSAEQRARPMSSTQPNSALTDSPL